MKAFVICALLLLSGAVHAADRDSISISLKVMDATGGCPPVEGMKAELLTSDSALIGNLRVGTAESGGRTVITVRGYIAPRTGKYIIRLTHPDFEQHMVPFSFKYSSRADWYSIGEVFLKRRHIPSSREQVLGEAVVKATKIKMVVKGDTLVYNADAFQLSKGSMLDALIERLPGVELNEDGVITVNGQRVSSLLVNGRDFFRGDPAVALENLPAYMVDKVKVYRRESEVSKFLRGGRARDSVFNKEPLVMDVNLKKEYSVGWIANAEGGYGTDDRYLGRLFALRFTTYSRLALFGNVNNTNDTRRPGRQGDWSPTSQPTGTQTSRTAGIEYDYANRKSGFEWTSTADFSHTDNTVQTRSASTSFLSGGQSYGQSESLSDACRSAFSTEHSWSLRKNSSLQMMGAEFNYEKNRNWSTGRSATFSGDPFAHSSAGLLDSVFATDNSSLLRSLVRNRYITEARANSENWSVKVPYGMYFKPFPYLSDRIQLGGSFAYDHSSDHTYDHYRLDYPAQETAETDYRNRYITQPSRHYNYSLAASYFFDGKLADYTMDYSFTQDYKSGRYELFRLDSLDGWGDGTEHALGELPSATSELQQALDLSNSEHSERWNKTHDVRLRIHQNHFEGKFQFDLDIKLDLKVIPERLRYSRGDVRADLRRTSVFFAPDIQFQHLIPLKNGKSLIYFVNYSHTASTPDFTYSVEAVNDVDPLYISYGNAGLKNTHRDNAGLRFILRGSQYVQQASLNLDYAVTRNAVAMGRTYNPETGGYTVRPENVNGNWQAGGTLNVTRQFGKQQRFSLSSATSSTFHHSVDLISVEDADASPRSTVRTLYAGETLRLDYSAGKWRVGAKARANWTNARSAREGFSTINAWDYDFGLSGRVQLPWDMEVSTDFGLYSRRGYEDSSMNTDDWIWNARISKSVMNGNLTFILDGFDILGQLSNVNRTLNAQGRVETWYNTISRYAMLHVVYRLNIEPKKK